MGHRRRKQRRQLRPHRRLEATRPFPACPGFLGSFAQIPGGNPYPDLIHDEPKKPLRVYLQATRDLNWNEPELNWFGNNLRVAAALAERVRPPSRARRRRPRPQPWRRNPPRRPALAVAADARLGASAPEAVERVDLPSVWSPRFGVWFDDPPAEASWVQPSGVRLAR